MTDQSNNVISRHDYLPFGEEIPAGIGGRSGAGWGSTDGIAQRFTGKERDTETGVDYFGARYYGSALGRFTSPDPLLNSGRPWEPQSWNRYAYGQNNPLARIDPTGLFDFAACSGSKEVCGQWRDQFNKGVQAAQKALDSGKLSKSDADNLTKVLQYLGTAGDKNGVSVSFGPIKGAAEGVLSGPNSITLDMQKIDKRFSEAEMAGFDKTATVAGEAVHESTHGRDQATGVFSFRIATDTPDHRFQGAMQEMSAEERAYRNQSLVFQGLGVSSPDGLWNTSWAETDREAMRSRSVLAGAVRSMVEVMNSLQTQK